MERITAQRDRGRARLTNGAPATRLAWSSSTSSRSGWRSSSAAAPPRVAVERRAERVLGARHDDRRLGAAEQRRVERVGQRPSVVDRHRDRDQPEREQQVPDRGVRGVLHDHPVAGAQMGLECALDAVEGATDDRHRSGGHAIGRELRRPDLEQGGVGGIERELAEVDPGERRADLREQLRVGEADR